MTQNIGNQSRKQTNHLRGVWSLMDQSMKETKNAPSGYISPNHSKLTRYASYLCLLACNTHVYLHMNTTQNDSGELISGTVSLGASRSSWWSCDTWSANIWGRAKACHSMSINKNSGVVIILVSFIHSVPHTLF